MWEVGAGRKNVNLFEWWWNHIVPCGMAWVVFTPKKNNAKKERGGGGGHWATGLHRIFQFWNCFACTSSSQTQIVDVNNGSFFGLTFFFHFVMLVLCCVLSLSLSQMVKLLMFFKATPTCWIIILKMMKRSRGPLCRCGGDTVGGRCNTLIKKPG